ncbi:MAG: hypothetical protein ACYTG0_29225, partial [Planctomycetota bacterium]
FAAIKKDVARLESTIKGCPHCGAHGDNGDPDNIAARLTQIGALLHGIGNGKYAAIYEGPTGTYHRMWNATPKECVRMANVLIGDVSKPVTTIQEVETC